MSHFIIICIAMFAMIFNLNTIEAQITISTAGSITTATVGDTVTEAVVTGSTESETMSSVKGSTVVDEVTATTQEVTTYIDETAIFCRQYLLNNTNWEPYPTYSDNGSTGLCAGITLLIGLIMAAIVA